MVELGQLEERHEDFMRRQTRIRVASLESQHEAGKTQAQFPHLTIIGDAKARLIAAAQVLHEKASPEGEDAAQPTTFLIDQQGIIRWIYRPDSVLRRLSPDELLAEVGRHLP